MNDQTFHTPSFGDEEFDIPHFNHHMHAPQSHLDQQQQHQQYHMQPHIDTNQYHPQQPPPSQQQQQWHDMHHSYQMQSPQSMGGYNMVPQQMGQHMNQMSPQMQVPNQYHVDQTQSLAPHISPQHNNQASVYQTLRQSPQQQVQGQVTNVIQATGIVENNGVGSEDSDDAIPVSLNFLLYNLI